MLDKMLFSASRPNKRSSAYFLDIDECLVDYGGCNIDRQTCVNINRGFYCKCLPQYRGSNCEECE